MENEMQVFLNAAIVKERGRKKCLFGDGIMGFCIFLVISKPCYAFFDNENTSIGE